MRYPNFRVRFRGFDRREVVAALAKLASENDESRREIERLANEMNLLQGSVVEQLSSERDVQRALIVAARAADDIRERAEEEGRQILRDAQERGEVIVQRLRDQARGIQGQIDALLARRREVETSMESFIEIISDSLERARQDDPGESADESLAPTG
ncbi:MAG TPA: DivIVA domain-containing protein [Vicinamibacterales bacterium]|nr:DivIVA domain-containing protein [Vicinamibacterales bacterium]